jgi:peptide/nickel transport system permease protein
MAQEQQTPIALLDRRAKPPIFRRVYQGAWTFTRRKPVGAVGAALIIIMVFMAATAQWISPYDPLEVHPRDRLANVFETKEASGNLYILGTDEIGRDILSRTIYGARTSVTIAFLAIILGTTTGTVIGMASAYFGGYFDLLVQRVIDAMFAFPLLIFALAIVSVVGQSMFNVIVALAIVLVPSVSRTTRGASMSIMQMPYIEATKTIGASTLRTIVLHLMPNITAVVIVLASIQLGAAIIVEASLSFLGLGTPPPTPSWGAMLSGSSRNFLEIAPHLAIIPGIAISLAVLGINLLGDAIRDVWDPRLRGT